MNEWIQSCAPNSPLSKSSGIPIWAVPQSPLPYDLYRVHKINKSGFTGQTWENPPFLQHGQLSNIFTEKLDARLTNTTPGSPFWGKPEGAQLHGFYKWSMHLLTGGCVSWLFWSHASPSCGRWSHHPKGKYLLKAHKRGSGVAPPRWESHPVIRGWRLKCLQGLGRWHK